MGEPKRFLTRLPLVPELRHTTSCVSSLHKHRRVPGRCGDAKLHVETHCCTEGCEPWGSLCRGEGRQAGSGGERFVRESFIPRGVRRKTWSCAARSVSVWGGWFTSLVLTEKHQRFTDTWPTS